MTNYLRCVLVLTMAAIAAGCTLKDIEAPPLAGPSEMSLSLAISANPDVLSLDGASQTLVSIEARDSNGQPASNIPLRVQILADGQPVDFGSISARTLVTGSNGRATFTYTAPSFVSGGSIPTLQLTVTPTGTDASAHVDRTVTVRLVQPGVLGALPTANFTFLPASPAAFENVRFDGSTSTAGLGAALTSYVWDFGDNKSGTGPTATHQYTAAGTYLAKLTVTDSNNLSNTSATQAVVVGGGSGPTAVILFSPTSPTNGQTIFFNGSTSTAGTGHRINEYDWDFGDGTRRSGASISKSYSAVGDYNVILTVTDEVGQTAQAVQTLTVGGSAASASFDFSPTTPAPGTTINFNASASRGEGTNPIVRYVWNFGCTAGTNCTKATFTSSSPTATNVYTTEFVYNVRLTVTDSKGNTATFARTVPVAP